MVTLCCDQDKRSQLCTRLETVCVGGGSGSGGVARGAETRRQMRIQPVAGKSWGEGRERTRRAGPDRAWRDAQAVSAVTALP